MYGADILINGVSVIIGAFIGAKSYKNKTTGLLVGGGVGLAVGYGIIYGLNYSRKKKNEERRARTGQEIAIPIDATTKKSPPPLTQNDI